MNNTPPTGRVPIVTRNDRSFRSPYELINEMLEPYGQKVGIILHIDIVIVIIQRWIKGGR